MKKIPSLFVRNHDGNRVTQVRNEVTPGLEWVINGEGQATRKFDGTCCMVRNGIFYKRYDAKRGKTPPANFEAAQTEPDVNTGHWPGWVPVDDCAADAWHCEAWDFHGRALADGTYELCGPKIQSNPEAYDTHVLIRHGAEVLLNCPRDFESLRSYLQTKNIEGVVWHHPDGRMAKIKTKDFGLKRLSNQQ